MFYEIYILLPVAEEPAKRKSVKFASIKTSADDDEDSKDSNEDSDDSNCDGDSDDDPMGRTSDLESEEEGEEEEKSPSTEGKMKKLTSILKKAAIDPEKLKESLMVGQTFFERIGACAIRS